MRVSVCVMGNDVCVKGNDVSVCVSLQLQLFPVML